MFESNASACALTSARIEVSPAPTMESRIVVAIAPGVEIGCQEFDRRNGRVEIEVRWSGTVLHGWVAAVAVRPRVAQPTNISTVGHGSEFHTRCRGRSYCGEATVADATPIYATPGRSEWGRFAGATRIEVEYVAGEEWARVFRVSGLSLPDNAWVSVTSLTISRATP
jgi:hypothetical protein